MVMPVLLLLFLGSFDAGNAIVIYMKVRAATYALGAITNQYGIGNAAISTSTMSGITAATSAIFSPYSNTPSKIVISQIKATTATNSDGQLELHGQRHRADAGASYTLAEQLRQEYLRRHLSLLFDPGLGQLHLYADVRRLLDRADHPFRQHLHRAAHQHVRAVQQRAQHLLRRKLLFLKLTRSGSARSTNLPWRVRALVGARPGETVSRKGGAAPVAYWEFPGFARRERSSAFSVSSWARRSRSGRTASAISCSVKRARCAAGNSSRMLPGAAEKCVRVWLRIPAW